MSTKGPSFLYGNTKGSPTRHINFPYGKDFNKNTIKVHEWHAENMKLTWEQYVVNGVKFSNEISLENLSFIREIDGVTFKYKEKTNELALVDKNGYIVTYYYPTGKKGYYERQRLKFERRYKENEK
ncbi:MAG: hypothetical protein LBC44_00050 [Mycoplasmataceae bacterium]|jgi:pyocin large subunit-like protein|nr:hypothetical protein [Mycoplasmataceae bacterium]